MRRSLALAAASASAASVNWSGANRVMSFSCRSGKPQGFAGQQLGGLDRIGRAVDRPADHGVEVAASCLAERLGDAAAERADAGQEQARPRQRAGQNLGAPPDLL